VGSFGGSSGRPQTGGAAKDRSLGEYAVRSTANSPPQVGGKSLYRWASTKEKKAGVSEHGKGGRGDS